MQQVINNIGLIFQSNYSPSEHYHSCAPVAQRSVYKAKHHVPAASSGQSMRACSCSGHGDRPEPAACKTTQAWASRSRSIRCTGSSMVSFTFFVHCLRKYIHVRMLDGSRCIGFYIESGNYWILTMAGH